MSDGPGPAAATDAPAGAPAGAPPRGFRSDNNAGLVPEAAEALVACARGHAGGYGDDPWTERAVAAFRGLLGPGAEVFLVATGTAANTLAVAAMTEPWQQVVCHVHSHWNDDESTAPERFTGCRTVPVAATPDKVRAEDVARIAANGRGDVHQPQPGVVTISNPTEFGTVYRPEEVRAIAEAAHAGGYRLHVDGARLANAVASLGCAPRAVLGDAGVDAVSFGGTKNGLAFGEAIAFLPQPEDDGAGARRAARRLPYLRKGTGHLLSKHRFVAAPFAAALEDGAWLRHAAHANAMARRLGTGLAELGIAPAFPVEANGVFVRLPADVHAGLQARGHGYYPFGDAADGLFRLMCSFDTRPEDVDGLLADVRTLTGG